MSRNLAINFSTGININQNIIEDCSIYDSGSMFATSHDDYYKLLLYGISKYNANPIQRIQNGANSLKWDHITPIT